MSSLYVAVAVFLAKNFPRPSWTWKTKQAKRPKKAAAFKANTNKLGDSNGIYMPPPNKCEKDWEVDAAVITPFANVCPEKISP